MTPKEETNKREEAVIKFFMTDDHLRLNQSLRKRLGIMTTLWLSALIYKYQSLRNSPNENTRERVKDGWFYSFRTQMTEVTGIGPVTQWKITNKLKDLGVLQVKRIGIPPTNYYKIDMDKLFEIAQEGRDSEGVLEEVNQIELPDKSINLYQVNHNIKNNKKRKERNKISSKEDILTQISPPTWGEIVAPPRKRPLLSLALIGNEKPAPERKTETPPQATQEALDVVSHWNRKGRGIFTEHKALDTKGMKRTLTLLDRKYLPKFGYAAVRDAIDRAVLMAHDKGLFTKAPRYKLTLLDFFTNESAKFRRDADTVPWFRRLLGERSHERFLKDRDKHPEVTRKIMEAYQRYTTGQPVIYTPKQVVQFRDAAERLQEYRRNGDRLAQYVAGATTDNYVRTLFEALAYSRKGEDSSDIMVGQLCSDFTWNSVVPRYITKMYT